MLQMLAVWLGAYILGSIPFGILWAYLMRRIDVRDHGSGRTGGTNVWRSAGFLAALLTAIFDGLKGATAIGLAHIAGLSMWGVALAGTMAVLGHNYSLFLRFRGGAGTGTSVGVSSAMWVIGLPILIVAGAAAGLLVGHASVASIFIALLLPIVFLLRGDLAYAVGFGVPTMLLTLWALRPNIQRLFRGEERFLPIYWTKPPLIKLSQHPSEQN
jgi:glycerol-3-phosphate acyltransferase PlsY